jgi:ABC-type nitrate/sulfonate/bicarbonate transport system substrate-binding protein
MKKFVALALVISMGLALVACGTVSNTTTPTSTATPSASGQPDSSSQNGGYKLSGKTLRVGTMANSIGLPVYYAQQQGWFKDIGLDINVELFSNGAVINESMAAGQLDMAVSGMASVYALSTGMYTYVGDGVITKSGQSMYARSGSEITKQEGSIKGTLGKADALKGVKVLGPASTTAHYQALKYMESFGLTPEDFEFVNMDYASAYQAFISGQGDLLPTISPYTTQLEKAGYVKVCDVALTLGSPQMDALYVLNDVYKDRYDDVKAFLDVYYRACDVLASDDKARSEAAMKWYADNGKTFTQDDMTAEIANQTYSTLKTLDTPEHVFGSTMTTIGQFFTNQQLIESSQLPNIAASLKNNIVQELKAKQK